MQKCPKCGYSEGRDWPYLLLMLAFFLVVLVAGISGVPKRVELSIAIAECFCLWQALFGDQQGRTRTGLSI